VREQKLFMSKKQKSPSRIQYPPRDPATRGSSRPCAAAALLLAPFI